jgi:DNA-binding GntR family transcriptional regulator
MENTIIKNTYQKQVYDILEKMIVLGELPPGKRLVAADLASSLGVSRSPVREAILQLRYVGLVEKKGNKSWYVSQISVKDIIEFYEVRKLLETYAAKKGCLNCPEKLAKEMKVTFELMEETKDIEIWRDKNLRFHQLIILSCQNDKILELFTWTMKNLRWCSHINLSDPKRLKYSMSEHEAILKAFIEKDQEMLEKAICEHIETVENNIEKNRSIDFFK